MKKARTSLIAVVAVLAIGGCSTRGHFVVPEGSQLYLGGRAKPETIQANGTVTTRPFGWGKIGIPPQRGIPYALKKDGATLKQGKLRTVFRGASLFWPPFVGILTAPVGLNPHITYNLVEDKQE
ncbi:MAG: hypothetical protein ACREXR_03835 [Gammaproteobacteria bacterium]